MVEESLRRRLEALNRESLPVSRPVSPAPRRPGQAASPARLGGGLIRSGETVETSVGTHVRVKMPLESLWQGGSQLLAARREYLQSQLNVATRAIEPAVVLDCEFASLVAALPERAVALDLETCGLSGSALFLVGMLRHVDGMPTVELLLARDYSEEAAVLASFWQTIANHDVLITFNGKSFDWPMVVERSVRHRLAAATGRFVHIDVLHHARRRWRKHLPNCRLQTLEQHVCRRRRTADIPGHCIPAVYADYVRTGFERDMETVLQHNALDLVTLFDLALRLAA